MKYLLLFSFCALLALFTSSCGNNTNNNGVDTDVVNNPNTADGSGNMEDLPVFSFSAEEHDFGKIAQGEKVSFTFKYTNTGKSDLVISSAKASCGCTVAEYTRTPVKPGAEGEVAITYNSEGRKGMQTKTVTLVANTQPNTKVLTIKAEVIVP